MPPQTIGPGPWTPTRNTSYAEVPNVPNWKDFSPRFGVLYDLFGTGKTALKGTFSRYLFGPDLVVFTRLANPIGAISTSATRTWADANGDFVPQGSELGPLSARDFGSPVVNTFYDKDVTEGWGHRGDNYEMSLGVQHELMPRVGVSANYFRRWWGNLNVTQNRATAPTDYDDYCITAPVDARLPGGGGNQICGLYDVTPAKFGAHRQSDHLHRQLRQGDEALRRRRPEHHRALPQRRHGRRWHQHGADRRRTRATRSSDPSLSAISSSTSRTEEFCDIRPPFLTQYKFYGSYPLMWGLSASATFQSTPGPMITATYTARNCEIAPSLGRNLSAGANGTATVKLIPDGTLYGERLNQVDFRLMKTFEVSSERLQAQFDIYNLFNDNPVISMNNTYGPAWQRPTVIQVGRLAKFGVQSTSDVRFDPRRLAGGAGIPPGAGARRDLRVRHAGTPPGAGARRGLRVRHRTRPSPHRSGVLFQRVRPAGLVRRPGRGDGSQRQARQRHVWRVSLS